MTWWVRFRNRRSRRAAHRALALVNKQLLNRDADCLTLDSSLVCRVPWVRGQ